jgi:hypothetical protein
MTNQPNGGILVGQGWSASPPAKLAMCEKCVEIDRAIERYRRIQRSIGDKVAVDQIKGLIMDLQKQKAALHPG